MRPAASAARPAYTPPVRSLVVVLLIAACGAPRARIDDPRQLPVHRYAVTGKPSDLIVDAAAFAPLARSVRSDLERDFAAHDIRHPETRKDRLFTLAVLEALDGRWPDAVARIDQVAAASVRPADKVMTGLTIRVWADAIAHGGGHDAFRAALERKLSTMPIELVREDLTTLRTIGQVFTPEFCRRLVDEKLGPLDNGQLSLEQASAIVFQRYAVVHLVPVGPVIDQVLGARGIEAQR